MTNSECARCGEEVLPSITEGVYVRFDTAHGHQEGIRGEETPFCNEQCLYAYLGENAL